MPGRSIALVMANQAEHRVATMCRVLGVSAIGYYAWLRRGASARSRRDAELSAGIAVIHDDSRGTYGVPNIHAELTEDGDRVASMRVAKLMRTLGRTRRVTGRKWTSHRRCAMARRRRSSDLVERDFTASRPNVLWVADATSIPTWEGFLYLAVEADVYSRRVVGWSMGSRQVIGLMLDALDMALGQRDARGVIQHSDNGAQYTSIASLQALQGGGRDVVDGQRRRLLRQRPVRELLRDARARADRARGVHHAYRGAPRGVRLHRGVLQPQAASFGARLPQPGGVRAGCGTGGGVTLSLMFGLSPR